MELKYETTVHLAAADVEGLIREWIGKDPRFAGMLIKTVRSNLVNAPSNDFDLYERDRLMFAGYEIRLEPLTY